MLTRFMKKMFNRFYEVFNRFYEKKKKKKKGVMVK